MFYEMIYRQLHKLMNKLSNLLFCPQESLWLCFWTNVIKCHGHTGTGITFFIHVSRKRWIMVRSSTFSSGIFIVTPWRITNDALLFPETVVIAIFHLMMKTTLGDVELTRRWEKSEKLRFIFWNCSRNIDLKCKTFVTFFFRRLL